MTDKNKKLRRRVVFKRNSSNGREGGRRGRACSIGDTRSKKLSNLVNVSRFTSILLLHDSRIRAFDEIFYLGGMCVRKQPHKHYTKRILAFFCAIRAYTAP